MKIFSEILIKERKYHGLTQSKMADLLGIPYKTYQRYEKNGDFEPREPDLQMICKIADILEVSVDYLLGRDK